MPRPGHAPNRPAGVQAGKHRSPPDTPAGQGQYQSGYANHSYIHAPHIRTAHNCTAVPVSRETCPYIHAGCQAACSIHAAANGPGRCDSVGRAPACRCRHTARVSTEGLPHRAACTGACRRPPLLNVSERERPTSSPAASCKHLFYKFMDYAELREAKGPLMRAPSGGLAVGMEGGHHCMREGLAHFSHMGTPHRPERPVPMQPANGCAQPRRQACIVRFSLRTVAACRARRHGCRHDAASGGRARRRGHRPRPPLR